MRLFDVYKNNKRVQEFVRFCIVGGICTLLDGGCFYISKQIVGYKIAMILGYCIGLLLNYILTVIWTFSTKPNIKNAICIVIAHLINLFIIREGLMHVFVQIFGIVDSIAFIPTIVISVIVNFFMVRFAVKISK